MRQLYQSKVGSSVTYACGAWFTPYHGFPVRLVSKLELIQREAIIKVSGMMRKTKLLPVLKELHLEHIGVVLSRKARSYRAGVIETPHHDLLQDLYTHPMKGLLPDHCGLSAHPLISLYEEAEPLCAERDKLRAEADAATAAQVVAAEAARAARAAKAAAVKDDFYVVFNIRDVCRM